MNSENKENVSAQPVESDAPLKQHEVLAQATVENVNSSKGSESLVMNFGNTNAPSKESLQRRFESFRRQRTDQIKYQ